MRQSDIPSTRLAATASELAAIEDNPSESASVTVEISGELLERVDKIASDVRSTFSIGDLDRARQIVVEMAVQDWTRGR